MKETTMKTTLLSIALGATLTAAAAQPAETALQRALRAPAAAAPPILAQYDRPRPTCKDDERDMPRGSTVCRDGRHLVCGVRGQWEDSGKPC
jgi:hypothetical protein